MSEYEIPQSRPRPNDGDGYTVVNWMPGVMVVFARAIPITEMIALSNRFRGGVISTTLSARWGALLVVVEGEELAAKIEAIYAPKPERNCGFNAWRISGHTGMSSLFMASIIVGPHANCGEYAHPHDADDFERCMLFLECMGLERGETAMIGQSPEWDALVSNWERIEKLIRDGHRKKATEIIRGCLEKAVSR